MPEWEEIKKISEVVVTRGTLGDLNFAAAWQPVLKMQRALLAFERVVDVTDNDRHAVVSEWVQLKKYLEEIARFAQEESETRTSARNRRDKIIMQLKSFSESSAMRLAGIYVFSDGAYQFATERALQLDSKIKNLNQDQEYLKQDFENKINSTISKIDSKVGEVNSLKDSVENFTTKEITKLYGKIFGRQANINLGISVFFAAVFLLGIVCLISYINKYFIPVLNEMARLLELPGATLGGDQVYAYLFLFFLIRLIVVGIYGLVIFIALKNFNVNMNLYNINKHRQNSLLSAETLTKLIHDSTLKDKIIEQIAETVYAHQPTGQIGGSGKKVSLTEIAELIKAIR